MERVTGPSSKMEADLRRLTDEIGGRVTGSAALRQGPPVGDRGVQGGRRRFGQARDVSGSGEVGGGLGVRARWSGRRGSRCASCPSGWRPRRPGPLTAPLVDGGFGTKADFERLGASAKGAIALVRSSAMKSFDDLFAEYLGGARDDAGGRRARVGGDHVRVDAAPRPALPAHDHLGADRADPDGAGRPRGRAAARRGSSRLAGA